MIVLLDNHDSFVYNLARYVRLACCDAHEIRVIRSDEISVDALLSLKPSAVLLSPGPKKPQSAGVCIDAVQQLNAPILGVCLGHQAISEAFGGKTTQSIEPAHGKAKEITHDKSPLFKGVPSPFMAGAYHSLISSAPAPLIPCAWSDCGEIMALRHKDKPIYGVQFHPESLLTPDGLRIIENFINIVAL